MFKKHLKLFSFILCLSVLLASFGSHTVKADVNYLSVYFPRQASGLSGYISQPYVNFRTYLNYAINQGLNNLSADRDIDYTSLGNTIITFLDNSGYTDLIDNWDILNPSVYPYCYFVRDTSNNDFLVLQLSPSAGDIESYTPYTYQNKPSIKVYPNGYYCGTYFINPDDNDNYYSYENLFSVASNDYFSFYLGNPNFSYTPEKVFYANTYYAYSTAPLYDFSKSSSERVYYLNSTRNLYFSEGSVSFVIGLSNTNKNYLLHNIGFRDKLYDSSTDATGIYYPMFNFGNIYWLGGCTFRSYDFQWADYNPFSSAEYPKFTYGAPASPTSAPTPTPIPSFGLNEQYATPTPFPSITGAITPIPSDIPIGFNGSTSWDNEFMSSALVDSTNTLNSYLTTPFVIGATSILNYFFVNSTWFKFLLICPIVCLIAFIIGRFRRK